MRNAAVFARRSAQWKRHVAIDTVPAIEDQLHTLQPVCSAQRVSTGSACGAPAVAVVQIHAIDGCEQMGLSPHGDIVETLCQACLAALKPVIATYLGDKREMASHCGSHPVCSTCCRPTRYVRSVFTVRSIGAAWVTS
ncbi:phosphoenolpyruvate carboxylase [Mycolicibacterium sp. P9-64]|uniref:phosphoenolpyruvate carboxylase n=1 Tax=Mycolicibacterium sp. P9-64 TaxID=2024612 RepID=UPI001F5BAD64|nr:phosphoenolpyruvate carboxylase [Mycolicibacterium sp. P9-64]